MLACPSALLWQTVPDMEVDTELDSGEEQQHLAARIWTTALAVATLETFSVGWLADEEEGAPGCGVSHNVLSCAASVPLGDFSAAFPVHVLGAVALARRPDNG